MRLRFGRVSLPILIIFAGIAGAVFFYFDNANNRNDDTQPVSQIQQATPVATVDNGQAQSVGQPTPGVSTRFTESTRQEIPADSKIWIHEANVWSDVIQAYLSEGNWDIRNLRSNAGHLEGTAWVSQPGNTVISGHVELENGLPGIFAQLEAVEIGDEIKVWSEDVEYTYIVTETYYTVPTDLRPLMPTLDDRLTLITCNSYDIVTNAYRERLIIVAERII